MPLDAKSFIESSFLRPLLQMGDVTDISYNGDSIFYQSNSLGRKRSDISLSKDDAISFIRQLANLTERQFSYLEPILDVSFDRYRINAVNPAIARFRNDKSITFSIRIESPFSLLEKDDAFFGRYGKAMLQEFLKRGESLIIGGLTSTGKTELEKWCLLHMRKESRVIVIDNVEELDMMDNEEIDLNTWVVNSQLRGGVSFRDLVKNALRNNPDYILVAEARGEEMLDALNSSMSGHPIITSIHAKDIFAMPDRVARLAMIGNPNLKKAELLDDIAHHLNCYAYLKKDEAKDGSIKRYLAQIGIYDEKSKRMRLIYERRGYEEKDMLLS